MRCHPFEMQFPIHRRLNASGQVCFEIVTEGGSSHLQVLRKEKTGSMDRSGPADHSGKALQGCAASRVGISMARVWMAQRIWASYEYSPTILRRRSVVVPTELVRLDGREERQEAPSRATVPRPLGPFSVEYAVDSPLVCRTTVVRSAEEGSTLLLSSPLIQRNDQTMQSKKLWRGPFMPTKKP